MKKKFRYLASYYYQQHDEVTGYGSVTVKSSKKIRYTEKLKKDIAKEFNFANVIILNIVRL